MNQDSECELARQKIRSKILHYGNNVVSVYFYFHNIGSLHAKSIIDVPSDRYWKRTPKERLKLVFVLSA